MAHYALSPQHSVPPPPPPPQSGRCVPSLLTPPETSRIGRVCCRPQPPAPEVALRTWVKGRTWGSWLQCGDCAGTALGHYCWRGSSHRDPVLWGLPAWVWGVWGSEWRLQPPYQWRYQCRHCFRPQSWTWWSVEVMLIQLVTVDLKKRKSGKL